MPSQDLENRIHPEDRATAVTAEIDAICRSSVFSRVPKLQRFLRYVCEHTINGQAAQIKEYAIARDIFERGEGFSPNEDSVVRRQAHALRQKLQEYYANEGRDDSVKIELPVGRYVPVFRGPERVETPAREVEPVEAVKVRRASRFARPAVLAACGMALLLTGWLAGRRSAATRPVASLDSAIAELWGPWLGDPAGAVVCFSNRRMAIIRYSAEASTLNLPGEMRASPWEEEQFRRAFGFASGYVYMTPSIGQTKMGEAIGGVNLANLLVSSKTPVRASQTRLLNWETLRSENLIIFGYTENNPWLDPLLAKYPFRLMASETDKMRRILNTQPAAGEPAEFQVRYSPSKAEPAREYALISMIAGVDGRHRLLIISGLDAQSTQEASEYLTDPAMVRQLLSRMRQIRPGHSGPWRFQMVLEAEVRDKVPTRANLVAVRVL